MNRLSPGRKARRDQQGTSLVEVMMALVIATLIIGPVGAWSASTLRHQGTGKDELGRAAATGLLNSYFVRDVASAREVSADSDANCAGAALPAGASSEQVELRITRSGSATGWVVYSEVGYPSEPSALWRRVCGPDGSLVDSTEVFHRVVPDSVTAGCPEPGGTACATDRKVSLRLQPYAAPDAAPRDPIVISTTRRTDGGSLGFGTSSPPNPLIQATPTRGYRDTEFTFDASGSTDPDGDPLTFAWTLPPGAVLASGSASQAVIKVVFPAVGTPGPVVLAVSDGSGTPVGAEVTVEILNRNPVAVGTCTRVGVEPRTFTLTASATDPDGGALSYQWTTPQEQELVGNGVTWTAPEDASGPQLVRLLVTSSTGASSIAFTECAVGSVTDPVGGVGISPEPVNAGGGAVPHINAPSGGTVNVTFTASPPVPDPAGYSFALYRQGEATPTRTSGADTTTWTVPFGGADSGVWEISLVRGTEPGPRRAFRINAAPAINQLEVFSQSGEVPTHRVDFRSADSDADGTVVTRIWNFGDGTPEVANPGPDPQHTYAAAGTYVVRLTVIDNDANTTVRDITVVVPPPEDGG